MPSPIAQVKALKLTINNEKVIISIQQVLNLIKEIRSVALLHEVNDIKNESKSRSDNVRGLNRLEMLELAKDITQVEGLIEEVQKEVE